MGTTSQKLTYLNDTKSLLKDSINSLGGDITSQTTFRQYANELDSIYSNLPKVSGTGSSISLSPTIKGRLGSVLKGNTLQDGTPTPDTPVEIQSVTGLQTITVSDGTNIQTKELNLGTIKLNKIGDYQDYITGTPDNWVLHKNIGKINIIVNSTITSWGGRHWIGFSKPSDSIMHDAGNFNRYKLYMEKAYYSNTNDAIYSYQTGLAAYAMGVMCNENDDPTTLKNKLDGSLMYYPLKEEITTPITNTELIEDLNNFYNAKSYNGQTNISVEGDLPMILDVSALKGEE